jgi:AraC-like DNA-binding protein
MLLLYITEQRVLLSSRNAKHLWPVLPGLIFSLNYSLLPIEKKEYVTSGNHCGILSDNILYITGAISILFYLTASLRLIHKYINKYEGVLHRSSRRQLNLFIWVLYLFGYLCICFGFLTFVTKSAMDIHHLLSSLLIFISVIELFVAFYIKPSQMQFITNPQILIAENEKSKIQAKKIEHLLNTKKLYLDPGLDLNKLSNIAGFASNQITTSIREYFSMSVPEFINMHRIKYAQRLLHETNYIKIDFLASECGFSSRSNFYSTFKKVTGLTPIQYKKTIISEDCKKKGKNAIPALLTHP